MDNARIEEVKRLATPRLAQWVDLAPAYAGAGTASFHPRTADAHGVVTASYDELGYETITMDLTRIEIDGEVRDPVSDGHLLDLISTYRDVVKGNRRVDMFGNKVRHFSFEAETGAHFESCQDSPVTKGGSGTRLTLHPYRALFVVSNATPVYWTAPLVGFISRFAQSAETIVDHPLRVRRFEEPPSNLPDDMRRLLQHERERASSVILFECHGGPGFIEPLPDYRTRSERTLTGPAARCVTSVIVGNVGSDATGVDDLNRMLPGGVLEALRLATGRGVRAPWVDLRDAGGALVMRLHARHEVGGCAVGNKLIDERDHGTTGLLITQMLRSDHSDNPDFLVPFKRIGAILDRDQGLEDQLARASSAAEGLCRYFGLNPASMADLPLPDTQRDEVHRIIDTASAELRSYAATLANGEDKSFIERRAISMEGLKRLRIGTTKQLLGLLDRFGLQDAQVLPTFSAKLKTSGELQSFEKIFDEYRNRMAHGAYLRVESYSVDTAWAFIHHITDILVRIVFSAIEFDGTYDPPCLFAAASETRQWATANTITPERLRYQT